MEIEEYYRLDAIRRRRERAEYRRAQQYGFLMLVAVVITSIVMHTIWP